MSNGFIIEEIGDAIVVRFNRPETRSPLSIDVLTDLHAFIDRMSDDPPLIFTGTESSFASGADLREIAQVDGDSAREFALRGQGLMQKIANLRGRTTAAVNGVCFGGALDLALACKKRIASPDAVFAHPGADLGIMTGWGGTQRLPRLVGEAMALEMFFTARRLSAAEALECGLVDEVTDDPVGRALR